MAEGKKKKTGLTWFVSNNEESYFLRRSCLDDDGKARREVMIGNTIHVSRSVSSSHFPCFLFIKRHWRRRKKKGRKKLMEEEGNNIWNDAQTGDEDKGVGGRRDATSLLLYTSDIQSGAGTRCARPRRRKVDASVNCDSLEMIRSIVEWKYKHRREPLRRPKASWMNLSSCLLSVTTWIF